MRKALLKCPIEGCWKETPKGRMCSACRSWWTRIQLKTPNELGHYLQKIKRYAGRIGQIRGGAKEGVVLRFRRVA